MTDTQTIKKIQEVFDINAIYARSVFRAIKAEKFLNNIDRVLNEAGKVIDDKPKPFVKWVGGWQ